MVVNRAHRSRSRHRSPTATVHTCFTYNFLVFKVFIFFDKHVNCG